MFGLCVALSGELAGQVKALRDVVGVKGSGQLAASDESEEVRRKRLEQWQSEAREALGRLEAEGAVAALPEGVMPAEMEARRRDLERIAANAAALLKNLPAVADAVAQAAKAKAEEAAWSGFEEKPPYSVLMIDELIDERESVRAKQLSNEAALANFERLLVTAMDDTKVAEDAVGIATIAVRDAAGGAVESAKWRLESARLRTRRLALDAALMQIGADASRARVSSAKAELALLGKKLRAAGRDPRFSEDDLSKVRKIAEERRASLVKEGAAVAKRLRAAVAVQQQARAAVEAFGEIAPDAKPPDGLEIARFRVEVAAQRVEALQAVADALGELGQLESSMVNAYVDRYAAMNAADGEQRRKAVDALVKQSDGMRAWESVVEGRESACAAELGRIESRASSIGSDDPRYDLVNEQRAARSEQLTVMRRVSAEVGSRGRLVRRWVADFTAPAGKPGIGERVGAVVSGGWERLKAFWVLPVLSFEDRIEIDGQTTIRKESVTVGMLLRALMFFAVGYFVLGHIATRIQRGFVRRGHIAEAQARTLRNWAMIAAGVCLALATLAFLKIPLTVFAFLGGALAIGVGFGTQTLIKNFISGLIVLAERKVRVGDVIEVGGMTGVVTEVNTRSSVVRSADDAESMVPNSLFLEGWVTNLTLSHAKVRRSIRVGAAYGSDPSKVIALLTDSAGRHGLICKDPAPFAVFDDFGDNALVFVLYFWVELGGGANPLVVASDVRLMIDKRFGESGLGIPFPQRDMHLTTGVPIRVSIEPGGGGDGK